MTKLEIEAKAADALADLFSAAVCRPDREYGRRPLYAWERNALEWLKDWRTRDEATGINGWTQMFLLHGPPPWPHQTRATP